MDISGIGNQLNQLYQNKTSQAKEDAAFDQVFAAAKNAQSDAELRQACDAFEEYFVHQLFKEMRQTIPDGGLLEEDSSTQIYEDMLDESYAGEIAKNRGVGISDMLFNQLAKERQDKET